MEGLPKLVGQEYKITYEKRGAFQLRVLDHSSSFEGEPPMVRMPYLKICLSGFLTILIPGSIFAQMEDVPMFSPSPHGAVIWFGSKKNFYDTKLTEEQKALLAPMPEDLSAYGALLKQKDTGMVRLHPIGKYEITGRTVSVEELQKMQLPILGGAAYYSFTAKTNGFGPWSEIYLDNNRLCTFVTGKVPGFSGKPADTPLTRDDTNVFSGRSKRALGILGKLGDVPLASVSLTTPGLDFLTRLSSPQKYTELFELSEKSSKGFVEGNFTYASVAEVKPDTTYVLRSIIYAKDGYEVGPNEPYYRLRPSTLGYGGSDILVAFRVLRQHQDGSVTIVWKRLQKFSKPKIKGSFQKFTYNDIKQLIASNIVKGMSLSQVISFLETNGIERMDYVAAAEGIEAGPEIKGFVYAAITEIERKSQTFFIVFIRFAFNEKRELVEWTVKKNRRQ
jgi:hypothetical protein